MKEIVILKVLMMVLDRLKAIQVGNGSDSYPFICNLIDRHSDGKAKTYTRNHMIYNHPASNPLHADFRMHESWIVNKPHASCFHQWWKTYEVDERIRFVEVLIQELNKDWSVRLYYNLHKFWNWLVKA